MMDLEYLEILIECLSIWGILLRICKYVARPASLFVVTSRRGVRYLRRRYLWCRIMGSL